MAEFCHGSKTESAGTAIRVVIPPVTGKIARLTKLVYEAAGTEHTMTLMRPIGDMKVISPAATSATALKVSSIDPGQNTSGTDEDLNSSDLIIVEAEDGSYEWHTVSSVSSGDTLNLSEALAADIAVDAMVWALYEVGRATHISIPLNASTTTNIEGKFQGGFSPQLGVQTSRSGVGDPVLISINNITAAGQLQYLCAEYSQSVTK